MTNLLTPQQLNQPRIVSLRELRSKLVPMCHGDKWAESAIDDLWKKGAPVDGGPGREEKRLLLPNQFAAWFDDFSKRLGLGLPGRDAYSMFGPHIGGSSVQIPTTRRRG